MGLLPQNLLELEFVKFVPNLVSDKQKLKEAYERINIKLDILIEKLNKLKQKA